MGKKLSGLVISPLYPFPATNGAMVRIFNITKGLSETFDVTFASTTSSSSIINPDKENNFYKYLVNGEANSSRISAKFNALLSLWPYHVKLYYSTDLQKKINDLIQRKKFSFIYCNFIYSLVYLSSIKVDIPIFLDQHNVDEVYWSRKFHNSNSVIEKYLAYINLKKTIRFERKWLPKIRSYISVSSNDQKKTIVYAYPTVQNFWIAPNGVDIKLFQPRSFSPNPDDKIVLGFMGSLDLKINQEAVVFLINSILPALRKQLPNFDINVLIIGRKPPKFILDMSNDKKVEITGAVDTVIPYLKKIDIFVCPLFGGAGTKLRLFEAMAIGLPIVGSPKFFEGVEEIISGSNAFVAQGVDQYVKYVSELILDPCVRQKVGEQARLMIEKKYSWSQITQQLTKKIQNSVE